MFRNLLFKSSSERYIFPILLLLINFILKVIYLGFVDIAGDEPFTIFYSQSDYETFTNMLHTENNPPLFFILLHYWIGIFGLSTVSIRFLPFVFSVLTVLFIYKIGRKFFNIRVAIIAALLFTFSNFHISYAHEARVYSLFVLLTSISMYLFFDLIRGKSKKKTLVFLILSNVLLIYSHFFGFFILFIQCLSVVFIKEIRNKLFWKYTLVSLITIFFYVPYIKLLLYRFSESSDGTWVTAPSIESLYNVLWTFSNTPVSTVFYLSLLLITLISFIIRRRQINDNFLYSKVILIWFFIPYLLIFFISIYAVPMFLAKYLIFISIAYYLILAVAINYLFRWKKIFYVMSIIAILLMMVTTNPKASPHDRKIKEVVNIISQLKNNNTIVYICPPWIDLEFVYHYNLSYFREYKQTRRKLNNDNIFPINNALEINNSLISKYDHVIYLDGGSKYVDKENTIYKMLFSNFNKVDVYEDKSYMGYKIYSFSE